MGPGKAHLVLIISASSAHYYLLRGQVLLRSHLVCCQMAPKDCPVPLDLKPYLSRLFCELDPSLPWTRAESPPLSASRAQGLLCSGPLLQPSVASLHPVALHQNSAGSVDLPSDERR